MLIDRLITLTNPINRVTCSPKEDILNRQVIDLTIFVSPSQPPDALSWLGILLCLEHLGQAQSGTSGMYLLLTHQAA
jgi:hypothetical protein